MPDHTEPRVEGLDLVPEVEPKWSALGRYGRVNLVVTAAQLLGWMILLTVIDDARTPLWLQIVALLLFCLMMQGVFTMIHEYCHRNAHRDPRLAYLIGALTSFVFVTTPTFMFVQHWGHHRRNRTEPERAEFIQPGESVARKWLQYYLAIFGGLWVSSWLFPVLSIALPFRAARVLAVDARFNSYSAAFRDFDERQWRNTRIEGAVLTLGWVALIAFGPWTWQTLAIAYAAFAVSWSSLQWVYHLWTPLHVIEGAYNLRAPAVVRLLFLNFNYNLTHHRHPAIPWQELFQRSAAHETQPLWYRYLRVVLPPVPFPEDQSILEKRYF
jgi:fatty acid desaturase